MAHYTDAQAQAILRDRRYWPARTQKWGVAKNSEFWIRIRPSEIVNDKKPLPRLSLPATKSFPNQPDGMWLYFRGTTYVDVLAVEICVSMQNLNDKRSHYNSALAGLMLTVPANWFTHSAGFYRSEVASNREETGCLEKLLIPLKGKVKIPVRLLRAIFVIPDNKYKSWMQNHVPAGHEFFMKHATLKSAVRQRSQFFWERCFSKPIFVLPELKEFE